MKRAFIIHGWGASPNEVWCGWLGEELKKKGFAVVAPQMPDTNNPKIDKWIAEMERVIGIPDKDCYLIGHSLGCVAILRYLEKISGYGSIGGALLIAGFCEDLGIDEVRNFVAKPFEWEKIKAGCRGFVAIHSDNDHYIALKHGYVFREKLGTELVIEHSMGHFSNAEKLPSALNSVLKLAGV